MDDVTMCTSNCPISDNCYRYMAEPNKYDQTYSFLESECIPKEYDLFIPYEIKEQNITYTLDDFILDEIKQIKTYRNEGSDYIESN